MRLDRYQRHSLIDWFAQDSLKAATYAIVGCGAIGNEVAKNLALLGVGNIHLYDFDTIELHNLTRSVLFREDDVGENKAVIAAQRLKQLDPAVHALAFPGDFWESMDLSAMHQYAAVFCCVDNFQARIRLNQLCRLSGTNLVNAGIDSRHVMVEVFPFADCPACTCYECNLPSSVYQRIQERYSCGWLKRVAYVERKVPTTIITSSLAGAHAASAGLRLGSAPGETHRPRRIYIDSITGNTTVSELSKNGTCLFCGEIDDEILIAKASSSVTSTLTDVVNNADETVLYSSDAILVSAHCVTCEPAGPRTIFARASDFDSRLRQCSSCGLESVDFDIRDSFTIDELVGSYLGHQMPAKFLRFRAERKTYVIQLEHDDA
ncbi:HesA/MoeB/ThiF family protein [Paraburkholderia strydomiana]